MLLLNLAFILQRLEERPDAVCGDVNHELTLKDVRLMSETAGQKLDPNYLYVLRWDRQPRDVIYPPYMICIGGGERAAEWFSSQGINCAIFKSSTDVAKVLSEIQDIFGHYHDLHNEYRIILFTKKPMHRILNLCREFMENDMFLLDAKYSILETCSLIAEEGKGAEEPEKRAEKEVMDRIAEQIKLNSMVETDSNGLLVEHVEAADGLPEYFFSRFFDGNKCICTLVSMQTAHPFYPYASSVMQYLGNLMQPCVIGRYSPMVKNHSYVRAAINAIIENDVGNINALTEHLALIGWGMHDTYQLVYIRTIVGSQRQYQLTDDYYRYENIFFDSIAVNNVEYAIILIHNATDEVLEHGMDTLRELMTRNGMECRISLPFTGLLQLKPHYDLVKSSLSNLGEQHDNVTMYKDMMVEHVVREINAVFPLEAVCHLAALQLQEYDRQNATELLLTLEKYLLNNRSISKAADELFIHRNTINYRLNKIEKITNISLNDMPDHLHLLLSCIVLRILKE